MGATTKPCYRQTTIVRASSKLARLSWGTHIVHILKKTTAVLVAILAALASLAIAAPAQAYPEPAVTVTVNAPTLRSGQTLVMSAKSDVACPWTATFASQTRTGSGTEFSASFRVPVVTTKKTFSLVTTCGSVSRTTNITVLAPRQAAAAAGTSSLPNTGGPNVVLLGGGALLVLAGAGVVLLTRRRRTAAA